MLGYLGGEYIFIEFLLSCPESPYRENGRHKKININK